VSCCVVPAKLRKARAARDNRAMSFSQDDSPAPVALPPLNAWLPTVMAAARQAGEEILAIYGTEFTARYKADASPVTEADTRAQACIVPALAALAPGIPIVAEESVAPGERPPASPCFWLVDPLDGTKEFLARNGQFTVNIALIHQGRPVLGVVLAPALDQLYAGVVGEGAFVEQAGQRRALACRTVPPEGLTVVASRSHGDAQALAAFLAGRAVAAQCSVGSSLKFCQVAAGEADLYPRLGPTMAWDTAAGDAVLTAAGGSVCTLDGALLTYGGASFLNPHFVAQGLSS
jgi:3'(2'), 5'-bisphosphate nucleotidase